jgi:hypothetical protein
VVGDAVEDRLENGFLVGSKNDGQGGPPVEVKDNLKFKRQKAKSIELSVVSFQLSVWGREYRILPILQIITNNSIPHPAPTGDRFPVKKGSGNDTM